MKATLMGSFVAGMLLNVALIAFFVFSAHRLATPEVRAQFPVAELAVDAPAS
jgi:hypothetical protein